MDQEKKLNIHLVTPERELFSAAIASVILPGIEGQAKILPEHANIIIELVPGILSVEQENGSQDYFALSGGYAEVTTNTVTILAETAEHASEIDVERAEKAQNYALDQMKGRGPADRTYQAGKKHYERAKVRLMAFARLSSRKQK